MAGQIRCALEGKSCSCGSPGTHACLLQHLESFGRRLEGHFAAEETLWHGADHARADWTTRHWIERLTREHGEFTKRLRAVRLGLEEPGRSASAPSAEMVATIGGILDDLLAHELTETRLFQRSVFEESAEPD